MAGLVQPLNFIGDRKVFFFLSTEDDIWVLEPPQWLICRDDHHFQSVDLLELGRFRFGGASHAGQLLVHAKVVLESNGG